MKMSAIGGQDRGWGGRGGRGYRRRGKGKRHYTPKLN